MGIYINNMNEPEHCIDCPFMLSMEEDDVCILQGDEANEHIKTWEDMKAGCPLTEVLEPHGRLIDTDRLCEDLMERWDTADKNAERIISEVMSDVVVPIVTSTPTVIERSKE